MKNLFLLLILLIAQESYARIYELPHCTHPLKEFPKAQVCTYQLHEKLYVTLVKHWDIIISGFEKGIDDNVIHQTFFNPREDIDTQHDVAEYWVAEYFSRFEWIDEKNMKLKDVQPTHFDYYKPERDHW